MEFEDWADDDFDGDLVSSEHVQFEKELDPDCRQLARYQYVEESPEGEWEMDQNRLSLSQGVDR